MEMWSGKPAKYDNLRVFGSATYARIKEGKLDSHAKKCIFLGCPDGVKGLRLRCLGPGRPRIILSRDMTFDEKVMYKDKHKEVENSGTVTNQGFEVEVEQLPGNSQPSEAENKATDQRQQPTYDKE